MGVAIGDLWGRTDADCVTAYIGEGQNEVAPRRGQARIRGAWSGRGRSGEPMTVYELRRDVWHRREG